MKLQSHLFGRIIPHFFSVKGLGLTSINHQLDAPLKKVDTCIMFPFIRFIGFFGLFSGAVSDDLAL